MFNFYFQVMEIEDDLISLKLPDATQEESIIKVIGVGERWK